LEIEIFRVLSAPVFLATAIFTWSFAKAVRSYRIRQNKSVYSLILLFASSAFISASSAIDLFFYGVLYAIRYGYAFSLLGNAAATIGLVYFATNIFSSGEIQKSIQFVRLSYSLLFTVICVWGMVDLLLVREELIEFFLIFLLIMNTGLNVVLAIKAYALTRRVREAKYRTAIFYIGLYAVVNIALYVFFILDSLVVAVGQEGTSVWTLIGACSYALKAVLAYVGFVKPMRIQ
jgi:hypothetical protein